MYPSCNIVVEPKPQLVATVDQVVDGGLAALEDMADDLEVISRETLIVDGRSAILYEHQGSFNGEERYNVVLQTIVGNTVWTNGCSVRPDSRDFGYRGRHI